MTATRGSPWGNPTEPQAVRLITPAATHFFVYQPEIKISGILYFKGANHTLDGADKQKKKARQGIWRLINVRWVLTITVLSLLISMTLSYLSTEALANVGNLAAFLILFLFIFIGILFDIIGIAATSATEKQFHSMAAKKVKGAKEAVWLTRNAEKVSSFCNDVVGDISGIISGATGAVIIARVAGGLGAGGAVFVSLTITGLIAAMTIGGKAAGKAVGIGYNSAILFAAGKLLSILPGSFEKKK